MKKTIIVFVCLILAASLLTACGGGKPAEQSDDSPLVREDDSKGTASVPSGAEVPDFASIINGNGSTDIVWSSLDPATRQQIIDAAKAEGCDVSFGDDGRMTVKDADGNVYVQNTDGSWTMQGENGESAQLGGNWPDNEFTKQLPKPDFQLAGASLKEDEFTVGFTSVTVEQVKAYAEKVKASGFTVDAEEEDQNAYGVTVYRYSASNASGYHVEISFAAGVCGLTVNQ